MPDSPLSSTFALLMDLCSGQTTVNQVERFYEAAADLAEHDPEAAGELEQTADRLSQRRQALPQA